MSVIDADVSCRMISVELLDHMGTDRTVSNAARVSFDKWKEEFDPSDAKLIAFLAREGHWSPFAHAYASFRINAPIFVARQLQKHTVGLAWNEVSRRYVDTEPTFYIPEKWRKRAENVKQGSSDEAVFTEATLVQTGYSEWYGPDYTEWNELALEVYNQLLNDGVAPELARMVLPQSMMTQWIWSGSLFAFARVCNLRLDPHAQYETRLVAEGISKHMAELFPESWKVLIGQK